METIAAERGDLQALRPGKRSLLPDIERYFRIGPLPHQIVGQRGKADLASLHRLADTHRCGGFIGMDKGRPCLQVGIDHDILADICEQAPDRQRLVFEIMDPHRIGSAREHVEHLVPAVAVGRRVVLGIGLLMDEHHGHTFDGAVFIDDAAAERGRRHLRRRRDGQKQEEKGYQSFHRHKDIKKGRPWGRPFQDCVRTSSPACG